MDDDTRRLELPISLRQLCHPDLDALFWPPQRRGSVSAWWGHVPLAQWLMRAIEPRLFVELGTHFGVSYSAFCEAAAHSGLNTRCVAVDTWKGDKHALLYDEEVYEDLRTFHDQHYAAFSTLLRCSFDEALEHVADESIDLLHIDGLHTYDAVRHDFESWLPKMSDRGVVLFHDIDVHWADFGVWRLWHELIVKYSHFEFHHCYGLGVLAVGRDVPNAVAELCALMGTEQGSVLRNRIAFIGDRWTSEAREHDLRCQLAQEEERARAAAVAAQAELSVARAAEESALQAQLLDAEAALGISRAALLGAEQKLAGQQERLEAILSSTLWQSTYPLRLIGAKVPRSLRGVLRRIARLTWRSITLKALRRLGDVPTASGTPKHWAARPRSG